MDESPPSSVVLAALNTLQDVCRNSERNRDAFIYTNMDQVGALVQVVDGCRCGYDAKLRYKSSWG